MQSIDLVILHGVKLAHLDQLSSLISTNKLNLVRNDLTNLSDLSNLTQLGKLLLNYNNLINLNSHQGMTYLEVGLTTIQAASKSVLTVSQPCAFKRSVSIGKSFSDRDLRYSHNPLLTDLLIKRVRDEEEIGRIADCYPPRDTFLTFSSCTPMPYDHRRYAQKFCGSAY